MNLGTLHSLDPVEMKREAVHALHGLIPSGVALTFSILKRDGVPHYSGHWPAVGDDDAVSWLCSHAGRPMLRSQWSPTMPDRGQTNCFVVRTDADWGGTQIHRTALAPLEVSSCLRALIYDGDEFVGWIGLKRRGRDGYSKGEVDCATACLGELRTILFAARAVDRDLLGEDSLFGVLRSDGSLEYATPVLRMWLNQTTAEFLRRAVVAFDTARNPRATFTMGYADVHLVRLDGELGVRYLASVSHGILPRLSPLHRLSKRQRQVARHAASGFTNREIADAIGVSEHTVREHLARAFRALQVESRLEFLTLLQQAPHA